MGLGGGQTNKLCWHVSCGIWGEGRSQLWLKGFFESMEKIDRFVVYFSTKFLLKYCVLGLRKEQTQREKWNASQTGFQHVPLKFQMENRVLIVNWEFREIGAQMRFSLKVKNQLVVKDRHIQWHGNRSEHWVRSISQVIHLTEEELEERKRSYERMASNLWGILEANRRFQDEKWCAVIRDITSYCDNWKLPTGWSSVSFDSGHVRCFSGIGRMKVVNVSLR